MIWGGALTGLLIALCIGGAFIAVVSLPSLHLVRAGSAEDADVACFIVLHDAQ